MLVILIPKTIIYDSTCMHETTGLVSYDYFQFLTERRLHAKTRGRQDRSKNCNTETAKVVCWASSIRPKWAGLQAHWWAGGDARDGLANRLARSHRTSKTPKKKKETEKANTPLTTRRPRRLIPKPS